MADTINSFLDNIDLSEFNSLTHLLDDDDDFNDVRNSLKQSRYCTEEEIAEFCNASNHSCNIVSLNCQSLHSKFQYIKILLDNFQTNSCPIQILCLQETWFTASTDVSLYQIENYHLITKGRYASEHGGLAIYVHNNWNYKLKPNVFDSPYWEELYIEVTDPMDADNKFTVGNFYRPPHDHVNSLTLFIDYFSVTLSQYEQSRSTAYMCGDYNINLLKNIFRGSL